MKAAPDVTTPTAYLAALPPERKAALTTLHRAIRQAVPKLKPGMCHGMIGYGIGPYKTKSGCSGEWFKVGLANQKNNLALYICSVDADSRYLVEREAHRLGKVSCGKSCIRFKKLEQLDLDVALELVKEAATLPMLGV
ncbi:DUF1801 domain-containing protein [Synoicihabitans lomoniglobus]|uniref:DUF1801 domain-containing protein n=1 Tax=Synoicihabitans lomoniglobus TaxID=2909285 RepID=A0AAF0CP28_9BACT|nr:DUF1801 domain-containing protein [Opitutaceae bacterium LMO-M01]WED65315.1 DUF1801 domain-containing protein [Opitutaceae bacterium LMO-M01]